MPHIPFRVDESRFVFGVPGTVNPGSRKIPKIRAVTP